VSMILVQPYYECEGPCLLRNSDSAGVCAIALPLTSGQWAALLRKHDNLIYAASADCPKEAEPGFVPIETRDGYRIYGPVRRAADPAPQRSKLLPGCASGPGNSELCTSLRL